MLRNRCYECAGANLRIFSRLTLSKISIFVEVENYCSHGLKTGTRALSKSLRSRVTTVSPMVKGGRRKQKVGV
jgi:hypothetical protein